MIFFFAQTPDGWGVPGIHGPLQGDQLDGGIQGGVYLIRGRNENILVDTGNWTLPEIERGMGDFLINLLDKESNPLRYIFVTHFHYDHIGNASILKERYGAEVICHPIDKPLVENPLYALDPDNVARFGVSAECFLEDFNLAPGEQLALADLAVIEKYWNRPVRVDRTVVDGDSIEVGGLSLEVVHLPGHTAGHIGLWNLASRSLYSSDLMVYPAPISPFPFGNARDNAASIQRCLDMEPEYLLEGHNLSAYSRESSRRRLQHMQMQQRDTDARILFCLRREQKPQTIEELLPEVMPVKFEYDYPIWSGVRFRRSFCQASIQSHLIWQIERGLVKRTRVDGRVVFSLA